MTYSGNVNAKVELITPEFARDLLAKNDHNRGIAVSNTKKLEVAITEGQWLVSGQTIIIGETGILLDGQHRLHAVINTNTPIWHLVARGVSEDSFKVIDTGKVRNPTDVLKIYGAKDSSKLAQIVKLYNSFKEERLVRTQQYSNTTILSLFTEDEDLYVNALTSGKEAYSDNKYLTPAEWGVFSLIFRDLPRGEEFLGLLSVRHESMQVLNSKFSDLFKMNRSHVARSQAYFAIFHFYYSWEEGRPLARLETSSRNEARVISKAIIYPNEHFKV